MGLLKDASFMGFSLVYVIMGLVLFASGFGVVMLAMVLFRENFSAALSPDFLRVLITLLTLLPFCVILGFVKVFPQRQNQPTPTVLIDEPPIDVEYREVEPGRLITEKGDF